MMPMKIACRFGVVAFALASVMVSLVVLSADARVSVGQGVQHDVAKADLMAALGQCQEQVGRMMGLQSEVVRGTYMTVPEVIAKFEAAKENAGKTLDPTTFAVKDRPPVK